MLTKLNKNKMKGNKGKQSIVIIYILTYVTCVTEIFQSLN